MVRRLFSSIEPLESRIAPAALAAINPLPDIVAGFGKTSAVLDLGSMYAAQDSSIYHTIVQFNTNFDTDTVTPGLQAGVIRIELFDDDAPLTVQNFLTYVNNVSAKGDYDNVFFHRSVNQAGLQVLQAGGFDVSTPGVHIPTTPVVPNEYSDAHPNVAGTLSLAKTGAGPNTGSSEFFFNMGDNSQTLGPGNNGGYTVFGKVIQGYDVLQKILARPLVDESVATKNGALGTVPYQGDYNSNPDNNSLTPSPALKPFQYITITTADVIARNAASPNVEFEVLSAYDHGTTADTDILTPQLNGENLTLKYNLTKSGVADVTIRARDAVTHEVLGDDTFTVTFKPNLIVTGAGENFQPFMGIGDAGLGQVAVTNDGGAALNGLYNVKYYLSEVPASDHADPSVATQHGTTLEDSDRLIGTFSQQINLASGKSALYTHNVALPAELVSDYVNYRIITTVTPADGSAVDELYTNDQLYVTSAEHTLTNTFGSVISGNSLVRSHSTITYLDAAGQTVVGALTGPGYGVVTPLYDSSHHLIGTDLDFYNTSAATNITFNSVTPAGALTGAAHTTVGTVRVNLDGGYDALPIGTLNLGLVDIANNFFAFGGVKSLTLGDILHVTATDPNNYAYTLTDTHVLMLGNSAPLAKVQPVVKLGHVDNTIISSSQLLASLSMASWTNDNIQESSTLAGVKSFTVAGGMQANVEISAAYGDAAVMNASPALTMPTAVFKVTGAMANSTVKIAGNVGTVDLGAIYGSRFLVGADSVPSQVSEFNSIRTIASFIVRGVEGENISMSDSQVAAANITSIKISKVIETVAGSEPWGFVADKIGTYSRAAVTAAQSSDGVAWSASMLKNLTTGTADVRGQYGVRLL
jgi:peptidyl-prolyl cis-trans isomerase A (cyclophilin A)